MEPQGVVTWLDDVSRNTCFTCYLIHALKHPHARAHTHTHTHTNTHTHTHTNTHKHTGIDLHTSCTLLVLNCVCLCGVCGKTNSAVIPLGCSDISSEGGRLSMQKEWVEEMEKETGGRVHIISVSWCLKMKAFIVLQKAETDPSVIFTVYLLHAFVLTNWCVCVFGICVAGS